jgi:hypothetical protein
MIIRPLTSLSAICIMFNPLADHGTSVDSLEAADQYANADVIAKLALQSASLVA